MAWKDYLPSFINFDKTKPKAASVTKYIEIPQQLQRVRADAQKFQIALQAAESPLYPNRYLLYQVYQQIVLDGQVEAGMLQRKSKVLAQKFNILNAAGEIDTKKTKILNNKWFYDFMSLGLDSIFWGYSLIQFSDVVNDKFESATLVPRIYVIPERGIVRNNTATVTEGVHYHEKPYSNWCLGIGDTKNLGILMKLAPYVIWKKNAMFAWSEFAEIFGSPIRLGKTDVRDDVTRKNMENTLKNMSVATWAVMDLNDEIDLAQASNTDAYQVFNELVERCNTEISKIILGQTGTTDEKAYSGSSKVHEDVSKIISKQDILNAQFWINDQLLPMMINLGFDLSGCSFEFDLSESVSLVDKAKIDSSFMPYFKFNIEYLEKTYGVEIDGDVEDNSPEGVEKKLKNLYR